MNRRAANSAALKVTCAIGTKKQAWILQSVMHCACFFFVLFSKEVA